MLLLWLILFQSELVAGELAGLQLQARVPATSWSFQRDNLLIGGVNDHGLPLLRFAADPGHKVVINGIEYNLDQALELHLDQWIIESRSPTPIQLSIIAP